MADLPKVLLVDDRKDNLVALNAVLESLPVSVINATSGLEALHTLLKEKVDLIVLDVQMPGMDGFETAELARSRAATRDIPLVFLTAISRNRARELRGYELGAVDFICKPFDPEVLRAKVSALVRMSNRLSPPPTKAPREKRRISRPHGRLAVERFERSVRVLDLVLPTTLESPRLAREAVRELLVGIDQGVVEAAVLLVSELVANAVLHASSAPILRVDLGGRSLRVEVEDRSTLDVPPAGPELGGVAGRGLDLVTKLAQRSGSIRHAEGKLVWFELEMPTVQTGRRSR